MKSKILYVKDENNVIVSVIIPIQEFNKYKNLFIDSPISPDENEEAHLNCSSPNPERDFNKILYLSKPGLNVFAKGKYHINGFLVLKDSKFRKFTTKSFEKLKGARKKRDYLIASGKINANFILTEDIRFNSISQAATVVLGTSADGLTEFR